MTDEAIDTDVDNLFEGEETAEIQTEVQTDVAETEPKGETPEETPETEPETPESEPPSDEKPQLVPKAAVLDERRKRQQLEEENRALREQIPQSDEAPDPYEDLDAYNEYMHKQWEKAAYEKQERQRFENIDKSRSIMLEQHDDFAEMEKIFEVMVASNPELAEKRIASGDEPKFAYETAKAYKNSLLGITPTETVAEKPEINAPNLASATAVGKNTPDIEQEEGLMDIFGDQQY